MRYKRKVPQRRPSTAFKSGEDWRGNGCKQKTRSKTMGQIVNKLESELIELEANLSKEKLDPEKPLPDFDYTGAMQGWIQKRYLDILQNLYDIMRYEESSPTARVASAKILLDRGFGQVPQTLNLKTEEKTTYSLVAQRPDGHKEIIGQATDNQLKKIDNA